jgi:hypothetical protein
MINNLIMVLLYLYFPVTLMAMIFYVIVYGAKDSNIIKTVISELPVGQLSEDANFHEYHGGSVMRYSLVYLPFGIYKIYLFTWTKDKINFFHIISLPSICNRKIIIKESKLDKLSEYHYEQYMQSDDNEKKFSLEFLQDKCKEFQDREKVAQFKAGFYFTTLSLVIAIIIKNTDKLTNIMSWSIYEKSIFFLIVLYIINAFVLLFSFISVKSYIADKYSTFSSSKEKEKMFFSYWYNKFQRLSVYTTKDISFIKNIEKYLKLIIIWSFMFALILMAGGKS